MSYNMNNTRCSSLLFLISSTFAVVAASLSDTTEKYKATAVKLEASESRMPTEDAAELQLTLECESFVFVH